MSGSVFSRLRVRLLLIILLAGLPAGALTLHDNLAQRRADRERASDQALVLARSLAAEQERLVAAARADLLTFSRVEAIRTADPARCPGLLAERLHEGGPYLNLAVTDAAGDVLCSGLPSAAAVNVADRLYFQGAMQTLDFAVGEYQIGRITGQPSVNFGYPVIGPDGTVSAVLVAALDLDWFERRMARVDLPPGASMLVTDHRGTVLARYPDGQRWVGRRLPESPLARALQTPAAVRTVEADGPDDVRRLYAFARLEPATVGGVYVGLGIPSAVVDGPADAALARNLGILGGTLALALGGAWVYGTRQLVRPVRAILGAARRLAGGDLDARTGVAHDAGEIGELARTFDRMAETVQERIDERTRELAAANERLLELDRLKSRFVADVSHELRAPVANLQLYLRLVERGIVEKRGRYLEILNVQALRLGQLIDDILDVSRLDAEKDSLELVRVNLAAIVERVVDLHQAEAAASGIELAYERPITLPPILGADRQLTQVVDNLVANALRYTPGGRVRVTTDAHLGHVRLVVEDTGIGIAPEDRHHIFDRFYRGRLVREANIPGTGLGLAIVKEIVEIHGGTIDFDSAVGYGSVFRVHLPTPRPAENGEGLA